MNFSLLNYFQSKFKFTSDYLKKTSMACRNEYKSPLVLNRRLQTIIFGIFHMKLLLKIHNDSQ